MDAPPNATPRRAPAPRGTTPASGASACGVGLSSPHVFRTGERRLRGTGTVGSGLDVLLRRCSGLSVAKRSDLPVIVLGDALDHYDEWPTPTVIVSDGAYGV